MSTTQVCSPSGLPSYNDIYNQLSGLNIPFDPKVPNVSLPSSWPSLPSMPSPMFPNITMPDFELPALSSEMLVNQFLNWIKAVIEPLVSFLGISGFTFPTIPELNLSLPDLINPNFNMASLIDSMKDMLPNISVPMLPDPLFPNMNMPEVENLAKVQALIMDYCSTLIETCTSLISSTVGKLNAKPFSFGISMPTIPTLPTDFDSLMAPMYGSLGVPDLESMMAKYRMPELEVPDVSTLFSGLKFPGFPTMNLAVPDNLLGDMHCPQMEITEMAKNYYMAMCNYCGTVIKKFTEDISGFVSFSLPAICVPVPVA